MDTDQIKKALAAANKIKQSQGNLIFNPPVSNRATTQDSIDVYNNALKVYNYYKNKKYSEELYTDLVNNGRDNAISALNNINDMYQEKAKKNVYPWSDKVWTNKGMMYFDDIAYRKNIDKNKFMQRETAYGQLDLNSPMQLFDKRILPTKRAEFINKDKNDSMYGDHVGMEMYDPIAVKPISIMTPEERLERERKYPGSIPKTIQPEPPKTILIPKKKPIPVKPKIVVPEKLEPKDASYQLSNPEIAYDRKVKMRPVPMPVEKTSYPALQYPATNQNLLEKIKSFFTGKNPMPYWTDKQGEKHYPHLGESNAEDVKQIKMLKSGLNPLIPEDAAELRRINMLLKMGRKERLNNIRNAKEG